MDLNWIKINGFKRFEKATLNTSGKVIALLGANEAGKSSLLEALTFLNHDRPFNQDTDLTRNKDFNDEEIILEAGFLLNKKDREALSDLYNSDLLRWLIIRKPVAGKREFKIKPPLFKDIEYHQQTLNKLLTACQSYLAKINKYHNESNYTDKQTAIIKQGNSLIEQLKTSIENKNDLSSTLKTLLENFPDAIFQSLNITYINDKEQITENPDFLLDLKDSIDKLLKYENGKDTNQQAIDILKERIPQFLLFSEQERNLESNFNLANFEKQKPKKALNNLFKMADLNIEELSQNWKNSSKAKTLINKANNKIAKIYESKWSQSQVKQVLSINSNMLRVSFENLEGDDFELNQRSDGLRQFVALINFLEVEHVEHSILLVDEAELHLHYNAQADLIEIFTKQKFASKIIYTTHSVGCLPEDLGTGVKLVSPQENIEERSTIQKPFGAKDKRPGVLPLVFGMGASQLAFMTIRQSVFVEGVTDMMLLPTLFRQAAQIEYSGFQTIPGIAMTSSANFGLLENHAPKVAFLVDRDETGEKYKKQLQESGIEEKRIFQLPEWGKAIVLEDYIRKELYLEAVNEQIKNWNDKNTEGCLMSLDDIPDANRPLTVKNWCEQHQLKPIDKVSISYSLLDLATSERQEKLIEHSVQDSLLELYRKIIEVFS